MYIFFITPAHPRRSVAAGTGVRHNRQRRVRDVLEAGTTVAVPTGLGTNTATDLYWGLGSPVWNTIGNTATLRRPDGTVISSLTRP
jgi:hypothetical protein